MRKTPEQRASNIVEQLTRYYDLAVLDLVVAKLAAAVRAAAKLKTASD